MRLRDGVYEGLGFDIHNVPILGGIMTSVEQQALSRARVEIVNRVAAFQRLKSDIAAMQLAMASVNVAMLTLPQQAKVTAARAYVDDTASRWLTTADDIDATLDAFNANTLTPGDATKAAARITAEIVMVTQMVAQGKGMMRALGIPTTGGSGVAAQIGSGLGMGAILFGAWMLLRRRRGAR